MVAKVAGDFLNNVKLEKLDYSIMATKHTGEKESKQLNHLKAENTALKRQLEIEEALERVRARALAMNSSDELYEVALVLREQMGLLGQPDLEAAAIHLYSENLKRFESWYAMRPAGKKRGKIIHGKATFPGDATAVARACIKAFRSKAKEYTIVAKGKELKEWLGQLAQQAPEIIKYFKGELPEQHIYQFSDFSGGSLLMVTQTEPTDESKNLQKRAAAVFDLAYKRFLDLKKAEEQAREAEIELALERIRARTMAMHHSDELPEAAQLLFQQVQQLGIKAWSVGYNIWNEDKTGFISWMSDEGVLQPVLEYPVTEDPSMRHFLEAYERGESFFVKEVGGEVLAKHYEYLRTLPGVAASLDKAEKAGYPVPSFQIFHLAYFSQGFLLFITYEPVPEAWDIFKRFGKVFEQTYTRFLDLKKAEEQAREAQIEAALERVRARAMAMHKSDELAEVAELLYGQLYELGVDSFSCGYVFIEEEKDQAEVWMTDPTGNSWGVWTVPLSEDKILKGRHQSWQRKEKIHRSDLQGQDLIDHLTYIAKHTPLTPDEAKDFIKLPNKLVLLSAHFSHGYLLVVSKPPVTKEDENMFIRFAQVFELTYTRFLDLKKAEEQAREAQIEAALERVRARTMAMHRSDELLDAAEIFSKELINLEIPHFVSGFVLVDETSKKQEMWMGVPGQERQPKFYLPLQGDPILRQRYESWRRADPIFHQQVSGKKLARHLRYVSKHFESQAAAELVTQMPDPIIFYCGNFKEGYVHILSEVLLNEEHEMILSRFTGLFQQTYTRFLDLKKAEEQALEAQIEAALERVRARTMAMQVSDELPEVALVLWEQLVQLKLKGLPGCAIHVNDDDKGTFDAWAAFPDLIDGRIKMKLHHRHTHDQHCIWVFREWDKYYRAGETGFTLECNKKQLNEFIDWFAPYLPMLAEEMRSLKLEKLYVNGVAFSNGILGAPSYEPLSEETWSVFKRLAGVFDLAYRRFEDLKKAEEQAREAQIEAALERIRAKALAMRSSEDLEQVAMELREQMSLLGQRELAGCVVELYEVDPDYMVSWHASYPGGDQEADLVTGKARFAKNSCWILKEMLIRYQSSESEYTIVNEGSNLKEWRAVLQEQIPEVRKVPIPDKEYYHCTDFTGGTLLTFLLSPPLDDVKDLQRRAAAVFDLAYRRFLDLKKAEAQAREAQIETALERVRARTMAMHKGDELADTALLLFEQITELGIKPRGCGFLIMDEETKSMEDWSANLNEKGKATLVTGTLAFDQHPRVSEVVATWRKGEPYFIGEIHGKELQKYYRAVTSKESTSKAIQNKVLSKYVSEWTNSFYFQFGMMYVMTPYAISKEEIEVLLRFAQVFKLTYRRFLDLNQAEEQAREAQIEAALERVRAASMAMHQSHELSNVAALIIDQFEGLGLNMDSTMLHEFLDESWDIYIWAAAVGQDYTNAQRVHLPYINHPFYSSFKKARKQSSSFLVKSYSKGEKDRFFDYFFRSTLKVPKRRKEYVYSQSGMSSSTAFGKHTAITLNNYSNTPFTDEENRIITRFTQVFDQSYTRFMDLKQAEAQAREAQIEAALEGVRASSMAMQKSSELAEVLGKIFTELTSLDVELDRCIIWIVDPETESAQVWIASSDVPEGSEHYFFPYFTHPYYKKFIKAWRSRESLFELEIKGRLKQSWDQYLFEESEFNNLPKKAKSSMRVPGKMFTTTTCNQYGLICAAGTRPMSEQSKSIFQRFGRVFEQSYTRFEDIKQAEEQAREAKIEAALERVRAAAMAMHSSNDLSTVAEVLHDQLTGLDQKEFESSLIHIYHDNLPLFDAWYSYRSAEAGQRQVVDKALVPKNACAWTRKLMTHYHSDQNTYMIESRGKMLKEWYQVMADGVAPEVIEYDRHGKIKIPKVLYYHFSKFSGGALLMISDELPSDEARDMQQRAAKVFDLAYRRFQDLQNAEKQARDSQIEAALERVRASTMAMHSSEDVGNATIVLFKELEKLGIQTLRCGVLIMDENQTMEVWTASTFASNTIFNVAGVVDMTIHPLLEQLFKDWKTGKKLFTYELKGKDAERYYTALKKLPSYKLPQVKELTKRHICTSFLFKEGGLFAFSMDSLTEEATEIFQKFTNVFTLTYRRFLDLKEAEARAAEAVLKSSLDRVRAEIASMRSAEDLQRITPLVWRELSLLGVPFFRCGVFIMDEGTEKVHMYLSSPKGDPLAVLHLGFHEKDIPLVGDAISHWKTQSVHKTHWNQTQFRVFTDSLVKRGLIKSIKTYQQGEKPPKNLNLHLVPFKHGMLYVGSSEPLTNEQTELVHALANAFSVAYARYEDFVQLEEAKKSIENTLTELRSAQDQLIHSEKMASLGELTAGIAHEIQNPLNFVNNFSEVSNELLHEMKEEIEHGNQVEVAQLVEDLIQNLDKIAHHGKRASSIVKGMLDHSRASSDEKVLTDINVLADEYLRLAYHGFRAKDKSFNASFKTVLADDLPKINIVAQDIGRVLLNLINNAFQAVRTVESPEVTVSTRSKENMLEISVIDNGNGIPVDIKEKIFQPFFTTKPTGEGTGLGLSLSYDIVTKGHGGTIEVQSTGKKGTEFTISLPIN